MLCPKRGFITRANRTSKKRLPDNGIDDTVDTNARDEKANWETLT
jgi:hypothetical protein